MENISGSPTLLLKIQEITFDISNMFYVNFIFKHLFKFTKYALCPFYLATSNCIYKLHMCLSETVWGSLSLLLLVLSYPITVVLCWITGLRLPPNNRVHYEIYSRPILWTDTWYLKSSYHSHLRCMALISCKYRRFFLSPAHGTLSFELS